jgi:2-C-methyl-D-erythritol 4-phosphate cytidylyltransferase
VPKAFVELRGRPLLEYSLDSIARCAGLDALVLVVRAGDLERATAVSQAYAGRFRTLTIVAGGGSRTESVRLGLEAVPPDSTVIVCHDAARPFASTGLFDRVLAALREADGAVPVVPSPDTVKRVRDGNVIETIPRDGVGLAQTPQGFGAGALRDAHRRAADAGTEGTDDAQLVEAAGYRVVAVLGEPSNLKVTTGDDLRRAEQLAVSEEHSGPSGRA